MKSRINIILEKDNAYMYFGIIVMITKLYHIPFWISSEKENTKGGF